MLEYIQLHKKEHSLTAKCLIFIERKKMSKQTRKLLGVSLIVVGITVVETYTNWQTAFAIFMIVIGQILMH